MKLDQSSSEDESKMSPARVSHYFDAGELLAILGHEALLLHEIKNGYGVSVRWDVEILDGDTLSIIGAEVSVGLHPVEGVHEVDE